MRTLRAVLLAIVATLALAGGFASTADARGGPGKAATTDTTDDGPRSETTEPGDPEIPPTP